MLINKEDIIDLSHGIRRKGENFPFHADYVGNRDPEWWCVQSNVFTGSHVATHVELPYHHVETGMDALSYPLDYLVGNAVVLDLSKKPQEEPITVEELLQFKDLIHKGDIIMCWTGCDKFHRNPERWTHYRYFETDAIEWLVAYEPKAIGVDSFGIEIPGLRTGEPDHMACFSRNIAVIECLDNLEQIAGERVTVFMLTLPWDKVDACPVRCVAFRQTDMFDTDDMVVLGHDLLKGQEKLQFTSSRAGDVLQMWYGMTDVFYNSHVGTHVVFERHHKIDGTACWDFPLENLMGEAVTLDLRFKTKDEPITLEELLPYKDQIHERDIILLWTGFDRFHRTEHWTDCRSLTKEAMEWLLSFNPKAIGVDAFGFEPAGRYNYEEPLRGMCFEKGVAVVEDLTNLKEIAGERVNVFLLALPMEDVDACPIRPVAVRNFGK